MKDINKIIERVSRRNLISPEEFSFCFNGKHYSFTLYRHYEGRHVSICNRADCDAGDDCCHYAKVDGIGLCCSLSSYYTLRVSKELSHLVAQDIDHTTEVKLCSFAANILDILGGSRKVDNLKIVELESQIKDKEVGSD